MKKLIALVLAMVLCLSCFAACGGEQKAEEKTVVIGYTIYEPMNYKDASGKLVGFDTELAEAVFAKLGYKPIFQEIKWESKYTDVNSGTIDCIWNGFTCNSKDDDGIARTDKVDFSYNYMENLQVVVVKKDSGIKAAADLVGKLGAAEAGSAGESYAKSFEGVKEEDVKGFGVQTECLCAKSRPVPVTMLFWTHSWQRATAARATTLTWKLLTICPVMLSTTPSASRRVAT